MCNDIYSNIHFLIKIFRETVKFFLYLICILKNYKIEWFKKEKKLCLKKYFPFLKLPFPCIEKNAIFWKDNLKTGNAERKKDEHKHYTYTDKLTDIQSDKLSRFFVVSIRKLEQIYAKMNLTVLKTTTCCFLSNYCCCCCKVSCISISHRFWFFILLKNVSIGKWNRNYLGNWLFNDFT